MTLELFTVTCNDPPRALVNLPTKAGFAARSSDGITYRLVVPPVVLDGAANGIQ